MLPVAILAGGLATRLRPITETIPKSLVEVAGRPFIEWQLEYLYQQGIRHVVLCLGYLGEQIERVVGDGVRYGLDVEYSYDGDHLLGTGGALKKALPLLGEAFFIFYGDSYLPINFLDVETSFHQQNQFALMTVLKNGGCWDKSNVLFRNGALQEYNKQSPSIEMDYIDYGLGILSTDILKDYHDNKPFDLADVYRKLSLKNQLAGYEVFDRFYEIGSIIGLKETEEFLTGEKMSYSQQHVNEAITILNNIDVNAIEKVADLLVDVKQEQGRIFFLGVGGSAGNCSHAVNDFRKIVGIESYAPTDNVSELTARTNDEGWSTIFAEWLKISHLKTNDVLFILSVGGGDFEKNISPNLVEAINYAKSVGAKITGVVGRDGGYTAKMADACVIIPTVNPETITPHSEAFQAVVWHLLVSHPKLKTNQTKWESAAK
jgi:D-sedoheptulose 7-phosphate isomerase